MITDRVNSTEHLVRIGDNAWRLLLAQHDTLIGEELRRNDGRQLCHTGDGVLATFGRPALAVQCACTIRDNVRHLGLQIRIGIHAGECFIGAEPTGLAFHIGARIASLAGPDEVLASRTVRDLLLGSDIRFADRGEHHLKGLPNTWHAFAVIHESADRPTVTRP